ncbi:hypothetical protein D082_28710 [Synechocystis sp. PCC 6714]|nr:hypothetical protein D082_28710 [Synechocystis sp. PCC 6714]
MVWGCQNGYLWLFRSFMVNQSKIKTTKVFTKEAFSPG